MDYLSGHVKAFTFPQKNHHFIGGSSNTIYVSIKGYPLNHFFCGDFVLILFLFAAYANVTQEKWPIVWLEDDASLTSLQLHVNRTLNQATEAAEYGCEGMHFV